MRVVYRALLGLLAIISISTHVAFAKDTAVLFLSAGKALEDQLTCLNPPRPGLAIRAMIANGLIKKTKFDADGSPIFAPTGGLYVFGKRVTFLTGWEMEGDTLRAPFWRGPGTSPPTFLSVTLDTTPEDVSYTEHSIRGADGVIVGSFSTIEPTNEYYSHEGTTITCYGG